MFHLADSFEKACRWLSDVLGCQIKTIKDINAYNACHPKHREIEIDMFYDVRLYYLHRRIYLQSLRKCDDLFHKAQSLPKCVRRDRLLKAYSESYNEADARCDCYPFIWMGEI